MKLIERPETEQTLDRLPQLPPDVEVPEDISALEGPKELKPTSGGVRWMRWLAAFALIAAGAVAAVVLTGDEAGEDTPADYMQLYGTDNPTFVESDGPGSVEINAPDYSYFELYGTDNPTLVPGAPGPNFVPEDYMALYGTDNPDFLPEPSPMELYGTDNPTFVEK